LLQKQKGAPMISVDLRPGECDGAVGAVLRAEFEGASAANAAAVAPADGVILVGLRPGRFASRGISAADLIRRRRPACGLPEEYADGSGVMRRPLRGSPRLAFAPRPLPECARRLAGLGGRP
jgi:hypothetical protein